MFGAIAAPFLILLAWFKIISPQILNFAFLSQRLNRGVTLSSERSQGDYRLPFDSKGIYLCKSSVGFFFSLLPN